MIYINGDKIVVKVASSNRAEKNRCDEMFYEFIMKRRTLEWIKMLSY